jgi:hypothetical protein
MNKQHQISLLRISCWTGALIDAIVAVQMLIPNFWASFDGLTTPPNTTTKFALGMASALMFGWTFLLIWADRKPMERKGVLLLTAFPVVFGLILNNISSAASGLRPLSSTFPELALQTTLAVMFIFSYLNARKEPT